MKFDISLYRGYVNENELIVSGHVFKSWAPSQYSIEAKPMKHALSVIKMFTIKPVANENVSLQFQGENATTKTMGDGYFNFRIPFNKKLDSGWHFYTVTYHRKDFNIVSTGEVLKPYTGKYGIISDIDDTFLVSHSSNIFKKLYVMLSQNIDKRTVFDDVALHYQALSKAGHKHANHSNSFFYVSSSEWNLYSFIVAIAKKHQLPKAVIQLKKIKTGIGDFLFTGGGNHNHKLEKIKEIISLNPKLNYVLIGDDSQKDPYLYEQISKMFPKNIACIYIRQIGKNEKNKVVSVLNNITSLNINSLYFKNSSEAILHSKSIGIIKS